MISDETVITIVNDMTPEQEDEIKTLADKNPNMKSMFYEFVVNQSFTLADMANIFSRIENCVDGDMVVDLSTQVDENLAENTVVLKIKTADKEDEFKV
ncbi:MAG: hypothetical protein K6E29_06455 [Cyanobacteria bacterium RUI128]|nr:hypothetical protein [Cyanobacteria bacterium RUI128]